MTDTTSKFHITKKGAVEPCNASLKACPLGGQHFETEDDAQDFLAFEAAVEAKAEFARELSALELVTIREGSEVEIKDRFGNKKLVVLDREWEIKGSAGQVIGKLAYRMTAHEKRRNDNARARRRWMAPGWVYYTETLPEVTFAASTQKAALEGMLRRHENLAA